MNHVDKLSKNLNTLHDELQKRLTPKAWKALIAIGAVWASYKVLKASWNTLSFLSDAFIPGYDLIKRYGQNSWALITGASDGIGKAFALDLAKRGFNIVLVGRNYEKLTEVSNLIAALDTKVQTKIVVLDLAHAHIEGTLEKAFAEVTSLDVSMIINNAGKGISGDFAHYSEEDIRDTVVINTVAPALITRLFVNSLYARAKKSAIINLSSVGTAAPVFNVGLYNSTKSFLNVFSEALSHKFSDKIDIIALKPSFVVTKMIGNQKNMFAITPEQAAASCLHLLGRRTETFGHWKHRLIGPMFRDYGWFRTYSMRLLDKGRE
eukprot:CAMPEP_0176458544 /NCGR_PEP_ID=MMETSP0127-20121128/32667_1 /TAXON_ID=938130 /ORGANISM="Platyophrya macrostoma, Strain WH" /LENGTH=320 /DNA_ID=CAMNT_0017849155 /DNA_START=23 /DNA_END=985 /DNA_ORIENTATION=+